MNSGTTLSEHLTMSASPNVLYFAIDYKNKTISESSSQYINNNLKQ